MTFVLDQTKQPKTITLRNARGETQLGIYQLVGNELQVLVNHGGKLRPTSFKAKPAPTTVLFVLEREKAASPKAK
jgi:hypothetical protein